MRKRTVKTKTICSPTVVRPSALSVLRLLSAGLALLAVSCMQVDVLAAPPPNIVIIYADDLGYGDVQCYNPERGKIPTPNVDGLAAQGMRFTDAHSSSGVCSPSRYTLLTGRYHWRTRLQSGIVPLWGAPLIAEERLTVASLAKRHGYRTAAIGKWHLGWDWPIPADQKKFFQAPGKKSDETNFEEVSASDQQRAAWRSVFEQAIPGGPTSRGFDTYFGTDVPNWPPYCFIENDRTVGIPSEYLPRKYFAKNIASLRGPVLPGWQLEQILPTLTDRACAFIEDAAQKPEPFLLYMPLTTPHTPLSVNDAWKGKSGLNAYADLVMETDAAIGRVLDAIDRSSAAERTLVLFSSDNGCAPYVGAAELESKGHFPSGPLRGYKSDAWEGGHRVPFIVRWPGKVQPGSRCDQLVMQADFLATMAEVLGTRLPVDAGEDSFSFLPLLSGGNQPIREHAVSCSSEGLPALRLASWKFIPGSGSGGWSKSTGKRPFQLYDLASDLGETQNLAEQQPERVEQMQTLLEKIIRDGRSNAGPPQKNDVRVKRYPLAKVASAGSK